MLNLTVTSDQRKNIQRKNIQRKKYFENIQRKNTQKKVLLKYFQNILIILSIASLATGQEITITGPTEAEVRQPVQLSCKNLPENCTQLWRIIPRNDADVWLEMYDRSGAPINIYWSLEPGLKTVELIVAVNGLEVPTLSITSHQLNYGVDPGPGPDPKPPVPVPVPEPELQKAVKALVEYQIPITTSDRSNLVEFYSDFSEVLSGVSDSMTNEQLKQSYVEAGGIFFKDTGIRGKYAGLPEMVDGILADNVGLEIKDIVPSEVAKLFEAIAWAFWKGGQS